MLLDSSPEGTPTWEGPNGAAACWAYTDRGRRVSLALPGFAGPRPGNAPLEEKWVREIGLFGQIVRTGPPTDAYSCHDWVFTGGRFLLVAVRLEMILEDNGYQEEADPREWDLVVYRPIEGGEILHSGVVRAVDAGGAVRVESKWAWMGRYIHPAELDRDSRTICSYYRSARPGHLLRRLENGEPPSGKNRRMGPRKHPPSFSPRTARQGVGRAAPSGQKPGSGK